MTTSTPTPADAVARTQATGTQPKSTPFQGLRPFDEEDAAYFFGRSTETELVCSNMLASRLTLVYGPSGVGKTSLLRAGVLPTLKSRGGIGGADGIPLFAVAAFDAWRDDDLVTAIVTVIQAATAAFAPAPPGGDDNLSAVLHRIADEGTTLLLILDQFEEYFRYHRSRADRFASELVSALTSGDLEVHVLIAIREDRLSQLDHFKGDIPFLFDNYLRIDHLTHDGASAAILEPVARYSERTGTAFSVEPGLVERVLDEVAVGQQALQRHGSGSAVPPPAAASRRYEATFLQLVMSRIWEEERAASSPMLQERTFERLGRAGVIVQQHLDRSLDMLDESERDIAAAVFDRLVTPSGTKVAQNSKDLWTYADRELTAAMLSTRPNRMRSPFFRRRAVDHPVVTHADVAATLHRLASNEFRILRSVADVGTPPRGQIRFEIYHDVLGPPIVAWSAGRIQQRARVERSSRRAVFFGGLASACAALLLWSLSFAPVYFEFLYDQETLVFNVVATVVAALVLSSWFFGVTSVLAIRRWQRTLLRPLGGIALSVLAVVMIIPIAPFQYVETPTIENAAIAIDEQEVFSDGRNEQRFDVDVTRGQVLTLNVAPKAGVDISLDIIAPDGTSLFARSTTDDAADSPIVDAVEILDDGLHRIVVRRMGGDESAALRVGVTDEMVRVGGSVNGKLARNGVDMYTLTAIGPIVIQVDAEPASVAGSGEAEFDAIAAVFPASSAALTENDDDPFGDLDSFIATVLPANAGSDRGVYHVAVSSFDGAGGDYRLRIRPARQVRAGQGETIDLPPRSEAAVLIPDAGARDIRIDSTEGSNGRAMLALLDGDGYWVSEGDFDLPAGDSTRRSLAADEILLLWGEGTVQVSSTP